MATTKTIDTAKATKTSTAPDAASPRKGTAPGAAAASAAGSKTSPAKPAAKKPAPVKLTENQARFLGSIHAAGEAGYESKNKNEQRSIDAMTARKLLKRGAKNKETGNYRYLLTKTGASHLPA